MDLKVEDSNRFGKLSKAKLAAFERRLGATLPPPYLKFLLLHNGGCPVGARRHGNLHHVFGLHGGPAWAQFRDPQMLLRGRVPQRLLPIADDPGGNLICLSLSGDDRGAVYFWDHEAGPDESRSLTRLADDFDRYLEGVAWKVVVARKNLAAVRDALGKGLDPNRPVFGRRTLVDLAVERGSLRMVKVLVRAGAVISPLALMEAVRNSAPNTTTYLLDQGADVNYAVPETGFTPLMLAASRDAKEVVRLLLSRGADPSPKNKWGKTASDLAHTADLKKLLRGR